MSVFSVHMLALGVIEVVIGLTAIGTLLAIIVFFVGGSKEKKVAETQPEEPSNDGAVVKVLGPEIMQTAKNLDKETMGASEKTENEGGEPVMAILQKPDSGDKSALPKMPNIGGGSDLPPFPGEPKQAGGEELERQIVEKQLQRIADKRAEQKEGESAELPAVPAPPKNDAEKSALPPISKPFLHELPQPGGGKPALPPPPEHGGDLPPMPGSANVQDEADLQTRDEERDS